MSERGEALRVANKRIRHLKKSSGFSLRIRSSRPVALFSLALSLAAGIGAADGQSKLPAGQGTALHRSIRCPSPANPGGLYFECVGHPLEYLEETLTKDWAGIRTELNKLGITPTASYTAQFMGNPSGGQSRGFTYAGTVQAAIFWDLQALIGIPGLSVNAGGAWSTGRNLSAEHIGNSFTVASAYTAPSNGHNNVTLGELYLQQRFFDNSLVIAAGRIAPGSSFVLLPVLANYVNAAISPGLYSLGMNDPAFTFYSPGAEWGAQAIYSFNPVLQIAAGVFNTNIGSALGARGGLDFSFQQSNRGALSVVQLNYLLNDAPGDTGLPGLYSFGGFYDSNGFTDLSKANGGKSGTYSVYGMFQQMVYRDGDPGSQKGLTIWGETAVAPKSSVNVMPYFVGAGLSYQGAVPGRDNDIANAGVIYGTFSRYIPRTTAETVIEANYQINIKRWISITPDLQYIVRPSGSSAIGNALVLGAQVAISF